MTTALQGGEGSASRRRRRRLVTNWSDIQITDNQ